LESVPTAFSNLYSIGVGEPVKPARGVNVSVPVRSRLTEALAKSVGGVTAAKAPAVHQNELASRCWRNIQNRQKQQKEESKNTLETGYACAFRSREICLQFENTQSENSSSKIKNTTSGSHFRNMKQSARESGTNR
jgi:hypothetical protein